MGIQNIKKVFGASVLSLGLVLGLAGGLVGAQTGTIDTTGPDSDNKIKYETEMKVEVENDNDLKAHNTNDQYAKTGKAEVEHNTTGGNAETGSAMNETSFDATVAVDNTAGLSAIFADLDASSESFSGSIENTGPDSYNEIKAENEVKIEVKNENDLMVTNTNTQVAKTGKAEVSGNTTGGDAVTGDASNSSHTTISFEVTN